MSPASGEDHASRTQLLEDLADLAGFTCRIGGFFPDGSQPDVLRLSREDRGLFVGDAKHTETPGNTATALRLRRYCRWLRAHRQGLRPGVAVLALCVPTGHRHAWEALLRQLVKDACVTGRVSTLRAEDPAWDLISLLISSPG